VFIWLGPVFFLFCAVDSFFLWGGPPVGVTGSVFPLGVAHLTCGWGAPNKPPQQGGLFVGHQGTPLFSPPNNGRGGVGRKWVVCKTVGPGSLATAVSGPHSGDLYLLQKTFLSSPPLFCTCSPRGAKGGAGAPTKKTPFGVHGRVGVGWRRAPRLVSPGGLPTNKKGGGPGGWGFGDQRADPF